MILIRSPDGPVLYSHLLSLDLAPDWAELLPSQRRRDDPVTANERYNLRPKPSLCDGAGVDMNYCTPIDGTV